MRAVLFDLDGTLLDIDIDAFLRVYFAALGPVIAELTGSSPAEAIDAVITSTNAMVRPHPGQTNREVFNARFASLTGVDLAQKGEVIDEFYARTFPTLGAGLRPREGARRAVEAALSSGLLVAVATNPIFPAAAISERIRWARVADLPFSFVSTYENMHSCKPDPGYYLEIASVLNVAPTECLMVGDDHVLDMRAAHVGMATFFVGDGAGGSADHVGDLDDLSELLPRLVNRPLQQRDRAL